MTPNRSSFPILVVTVLVLGGCGKDESAGPPSAKDCQGGWQRVTEPRPEPAPLALTFSDDALYYGAYLPSPDGKTLNGQIEIQPLGSGAARGLGTGFANDLWIEGDQIYFAAGSVLRRIPKQGGAATLVAGKDVAPWNQQRPVIETPLLSATTFFWWEGHEEMAPAQFQVWMSPRNGGDSRLLGFLPLADNFEAMALGPNAVIVAGEQYGAAIPLDGGSPRILAKAGVGLIGFDAKGGVYGVRPAASNPEQYEIVMVPADGAAPQPIWPDKPGTFYATELWADGNRGFIITGLEKFDGEQSARTSAYFVDGDRSSRAGCAAHRVFTTARPAFTADAAYLVADDFDLGTWTIVRVPRPTTSSR